MSDPRPAPAPTGSGDALTASDAPVPPPVAGDPAGRGPTALGPDQVGERVSVRRQLPAGSPAGAGDVVGTLVAATAQRIVVRGRDGTDTTVTRDSVVAARTVRGSAVRLRRAADVDPAVLERVAALGWQPAQSLRLGGWTLRAAHGFTGRANSVLPLGEPGPPLDEAVERVVAWYAERGLRARFQVPLPWAGDLDEALAARGWEPLTPTHVMVADVTDAARAVAPGSDGGDVSVAVTSTPDDDWLATYRYRGAPLPTDALDVLLRAAHPVFVTVRDADGPVAVGRGALDAGWLGITAVDVVERARRRGHARTVMRSLLAVAQEAGVRFAYLQVADDNTSALALYTAAGFVRHHDYVYRAAPGSGA